MRFVQEYRQAAAVRTLARAIEQTARRPWTLMEVCGGQTHTIARFGLEELLPPSIKLVHGPGCPVCVTPVEVIDRAIELAKQRRVILCSFGDMLRVPGRQSDLLSAKAQGADVRMVYSPLDALALARAEPLREVVCFAVGFETTAPAHALAVLRARQEGVRNFSMLVSHVLVPPAMEAVLTAPGNRVQGFLAAGHVCTVVGFADYEPIAARHRVPIVVTGFEPVDILEGIWLCIRQLEEGRAQVENQYTRAVRREGNRVARDLIHEVFEVAPRPWRGMGWLPASGLSLRAKYTDFDAERRFGLPPVKGESGEGVCRAGEVLRGLLRPNECPMFGVQCTPETPLGAPMVSNEGACAAYFRYRRLPVANAR